MSRVQALEKMLADGKDSHLLRFGLGQAYLDAEQAGQAVIHLQQCVALAPAYSAAWNLLGQAYLADGQAAQAAETWEQGIQVAQEKGDKQAEKVMTVFLKRARKQLDGA